MVYCEWQFIQLAESTTKQSLEPPTQTQRDTTPIEVEQEEEVSDIIQKPTCRHIQMVTSDMPFVVTEGLLDALTPIASGDVWPVLVEDQLTNNSEMF